MKKLNKLERTIQQATHNYLTVTGQFRKGQEVDGFNYNKIVDDVANKIVADSFFQNLTRRQKEGYEPLFAFNRDTEYGFRKFRIIYSPQTKQLYESLGFERCSLKD